MARRAALAGAVASRDVAFDDDWSSGDRCSTTCATRWTTTSTRPRHCARSTRPRTRGPTSPRPLPCSALRCSDERQRCQRSAVELPDGSARSLAEGATALDLARAIGKRLAKDALAAQVNGLLTDLAAPLADGDKVAIVTPASEDGREVIRHSSAHVLAQAVTRLWPGAHYAIGPAIRDGFYYDFELPGGAHFSDDDLARVDAEMRAIIAEDQPFTASTSTRSTTAWRSSRISPSRSRSSKRSSRQRGRPRRGLGEVVESSSRRTRTRRLSWTSVAARTCPQPRGSVTSD